MWNPLDRAFLDVRVFNALVVSNRSHKTNAKMYRHHEALKKTAYNVRIIQVETAVFAPIVFSTTGGMGTEAERFFKTIAEITALKATGTTNNTTVPEIPTIDFNLILASIC